MLKPPFGYGEFFRVKVASCSVFRRTVLLGLLAGALIPASAQAADQLVKVGQFSFPVYVAGPPSDTHRLMVVEQGGRIQLMVDGQKQATPFLDISGEVKSLAGSGEQGLLSMAFAPDYATTGKFYVYYTSRSCPNSPGCDEHVSQFTRSPTNPNVADASSEHVLLTIPHPTDTNHNGGQLQFGPDGYLYISTGDGGDSNDTHHNAQFRDNSHLLGKILRIDPNNPTASVSGNFPGTPIYAYGLRNPWRFSFDRLTGDMIIGDVGQGAREEIDFAHPGQNAQANYGWPCFEGSQTNSAASGYPECNPLPSEVPPVFDYAHNGSPPSIGIIGGYVVRDPSLSDLYGRYIYGDLNSSSSRGLSSIVLGQPAATDNRSLPLNVAGLSSFGEDAEGCIYAASQSNGGVWRIAPDTNPSPGPCSGTPSTVGTAPAKDTTEPSLTLRRRRRQRVLRIHSITVGATSNELVTFTATATVSVPKRASTLHFKGVTRERVAAGERVTLKLRLTKRSLRSVRRAMSHHRTRLAHVTVTARDSSGNARSHRIAIRLVH